MKQKKKIVIINPSGSEEMTQDIARAARSYAAGRFEVIAIAINGMKKFIDYEVDIKDALPDMAQIVKDYETEADAFLVSCQLDPNVEYLRRICIRPLIGTGEASIHLAAMMGSKFAIIDEDAHAAAFKRELARRYGMGRYCACALSTDKEPGSRQDAYSRAILRAVKENSADVIVLGGEGESELVEDLRFCTNMPVLDGLTCGLILAEGMANAEYRRGTGGNLFYR